MIGTPMCRIVSVALLSAERRRPSGFSADRLVTRSERLGSRQPSRGLETPWSIESTLRLTVALLTILAVLAVGCAPLNALAPAGSDPLRNGKPSGADPARNRSVTILYTGFGEGNADPIDTCG